ncbi:MAG: hypothetical protein V9E88_06860 [Ferruginibacter sp.]
MLAGNYNIVRSPKSYNSQVGVPLSIWGMDEAHTLGIFEAGISRRNEMALTGKNHSARNWRIRFYGRGACGRIFRYS